MASVGIKGFYRNQKKGAAVPKQGSAKPAIGSNPIGLIPASPGHQGAEAEEEAEAKLRRFDMEMRYGPCIGLTRMQRWDRASAMGLNPPADVEAILLQLEEGGGGGGLNECLWEGRI